MARGASAIMSGAKVTKEAKGQAKLKELLAAKKAAEKDLAKAQKAFDKADAAVKKQEEKLTPKAPAEDTVASGDPTTGTAA